MNNQEPGTLKDEELVRLYVSSQKNLYFEELYERYSEKVYRKCLSFVKDQAKAEDFTHDIFLKVITKIGTFKESARFSTWLYSITYNYCMDMLRKQKRLQEDSLEEPMEFVEENVDHELLSMKKEGLQKSLEEISPDEKAMLLMKYQDEFSIKEIAQTFQISESATKMRLLRTKEKMKKLYLEHVILISLFVLKILLLFRK
ncbi:RNA polymerase sigma factor [Jiulongibacter sediminis]|uniref:RNA polymerase subunit sigma-24 n=1 Tax=Jiulongibacter sediminis TaxID=1605367 RepID=A0A0P7BT89_9BACT|nr:sigma-70 family RNA polymerase sigma factor [Jiulongibacter sediminis]KPM47743.1 RNA polymerase subunit sigma-24 [Jiulongibacter sediminis]TBX23926.1 RNA polymerase subunit sigma-24 [Jiulongibacter sediminis]